MIEYISDNQYEIVLAIGKMTIPAITIVPAYEAIGANSATADWYEIVSATIIRKLCV